MQEKEDLRLWKQFKTQAKLSNDQLNQFKHYLELLISWNEKFNITAITSPRLVIKHHFLDSLALGEHYDLTKSLLICDIGTGGGLPGLALKIKYPHLKVILIEVSKKKVYFWKKSSKSLVLKTSRSAIWTLEPS